MGSSDTDADSRVLKLIAGRPLSQEIRVVDAANVWPSLPELEVRAQLRTGPTVQDGLIANLHDFMDSHYDGNDLVINWTMSGEETREMYGRTWGYLKTGYFSIVVSDPGPEDERAIVVPMVTLKGANTTTTAAGDV